MTKEHIGDGVYVEFDGFGFLLSTPRPEGEHYVYLEPQVLSEFTQYVHRTHEEIAALVVNQQFMRAETIRRPGRESLTLYAPATLPEPNSMLEPEVKLHVQKDYEPTGL